MSFATVSEGVVSAAYLRVHLQFAVRGLPRRLGFSEGLMIGKMTEIFGLSVVTELCEIVAWLTQDYHKISLTCPQS